MWRGLLAVCRMAVSQQDNRPNWPSKGERRHYRCNSIRWRRKLYCDFQGVFPANRYGSSLSRFSRKRFFCCCLPFCTVNVNTDLHWYIFHFRYTLHIWSWIVRAKWGGRGGWWESSIYWYFHPCHVVYTTVLCLSCIKSYIKNNMTDLAVSIIREAFFK